MPVRVGPTSAAGFPEQGPARRDALTRRQLGALTSRNVGDVGVVRAGQAARGG